MSWATIALLGAVCGAWLKRWVWARSHNGILGWFRRRWFTIKGAWKRWRFKRAAAKGRVVR